MSASPAASPNPASSKSSERPPCIATTSLIVNKTTVTNLAAKEFAVIKQPTGTTTLSLKRGERVEKLCEFPISKNRLTTVTLTTTNALVRCTTQS